MSELQPGTFKAFVKDFGIQTTQNGAPQAMIKFHIPEVGKEITWWSVFRKKNGEVMDSTFKALINCGFKGTDVSQLAEGPNSGCLDVSKEVELVLENNTYNGKTTLRVAWINDPSFSTQNKLDRAGAVQVMQGMNFAGDLIRLRQEMGATNDTTESDNKGQTTEEPGANRGAENVPF